MALTVDGWRMVHSVEYLPHKHEDLSSDVHVCAPSAGERQTHRALELTG